MLWQGLHCPDLEMGETDVWTTACGSLHVPKEPGRHPVLSNTEVVQESDNTLAL
jgi:hypothetical protein